MYHDRPETQNASYQSETRMQHTNKTRSLLHSQPVAAKDSEGKGKTGVLAIAISDSCSIVRMTIVASDALHLSNDSKFQ
ncbi:hypothetical protein Chro_2559 [Chroococcidiopsis thermalis PCC 7203]|uniref:Uncharacterized protein n=2 Tax=Chroococcidiopsidaceae TaxID=1890528 RepID=K9TYW9_CHRTP|nr:hypothetical protein Chro_2559 [Chroococcidiopsis thermalis PCC 7203]PSB45088.1 hypothetical protein C7B80_18330 [Cyanosarcina cf. burmensis CCALA 770]